MIAPADFVQKWNHFKAAQPVLADDEDFNLQPTSLSIFETKAVPEIVKSFLIQAGLPKSASPCVSFDEVRTLPYLWDIFSPTSWRTEDKERLKQYLMIGSDGAGNPICIDTNGEGHVVMLDHEDNFGTKQFVNSSISQLAEYLLVVNFGSNIKSQLEEIDFTAMQKGSFWWYEIESINY